MQHFEMETEASSWRAHTPTAPHDNILRPSPQTVGGAAPGARMRAAADALVSSSPQILLQQHTPGRLPQELSTTGATENSSTPPVQNKANGVTGGRSSPVVASGGHPDARPVAAAAAAPDRKRASGLAALHIQLNHITEGACARV